MSTQLLAIIDGCEEKGYIEPQRNLHPGMRFKFRPFLIDERTRLLALNRELTADAQHQNTLEQIAVRITEWNLRDRNGQPIPIAAKTLGTLKPKLYDRVLGIITGLDGSDDDPQASAGEKHDASTDQRAAVEQSRPVGDVRLERQEKN